MEVIYHVGNQVKVEISRTITVGGEYRISTSYGYAGITSGVVQPVAILSPEDIMNIAGDADANDVVTLIESFKDNMLSLYTDRDGDPEEGYGEELRRLDTCIWVAYQYIYSNHDDIYVFPLEEFIDHTTVAI